jgi:hypothetical protein
VWRIVTLFAAVLLSLNTISDLRLRCVEDAGDATTVVVVAVEMTVFVRPGVTVDPDRSTYDACT